MAGIDGYCTEEIQALQFRFPAGSTIDIDICFNHSFERLEILCWGPARANDSKPFVLDGEPGITGWATLNINCVATGGGIYCSLNATVLRHRRWIIAHCSNGSE